jgi:hypothetical protein
MAKGDPSDIIAPNAMQVWLCTRIRKSDRGYEKRTYKEFQVCGQYSNNGFEMHNKQNGLVSGCTKGKTKDR